MLRELLAANIARAFAEKGCSKKALGDKLNTHPNIVARWITGKSAPELENVEALAEVLGKDPTWFFTKHGEVEASVPTLPEPPAGTPPELVAWFTESLRLARNPLTRLQEVSATCITMPVIAEVADLAHVVEEMLEAEPEEVEPSLNSLAKSLPPEDLTTVQFLTHL